MKDVLYEVRCLKSNEDISSHLLDNLSNCLINLKNSADSTGFEPMTEVIIISPHSCESKCKKDICSLCPLHSSWSFSAS